MENPATWNATKKLIARLMTSNDETVIEQLLQGLISSGKVIGSVEVAREAIARGWQTHQKNLRDHVCGLSGVSIIYNHLTLNGSIKED